MNIYQCLDFFQNIVQLFSPILHIYHFNYFHQNYFKVISPIPLLSPIPSYYADNLCIGTCPEHSRCEKGVCVCNHDKGITMVSRTKAIPIYCHVWPFSCTWTFSWEKCHHHHHRHHHIVITVIIAIIMITTKREA